MTAQGVSSPVAGGRHVSSFNQLLSNASCAEGFSTLPRRLVHGWMKRFLPDALHPSVPFPESDGSLSALGAGLRFTDFTKFPLKTSVIITSLTGKARSTDEYRYFISCHASPYTNAASCVAISFGFRVYLEMCQCRRERDFLRRWLCHSWYLPASKQ